MFLAQEIQHFLETWILVALLQIRCVYELHETLRKFLFPLTLRLPLGIVLLPVLVFVRAELALQLLRVFLLHFLYFIVSFRTEPPLHKTFLLSLCVLGAKPL